MNPPFSAFEVILAIGQPGLFRMMKGRDFDGYAGATDQMLIGHLADMPHAEILVGIDAEGQFRIETYLPDGSGFLWLAGKWECIISPEPDHPDKEWAASASQRQPASGPADPAGQPDQHNGWPNRESWLIAMHIDQSPSIQRAAIALAKAAAGPDHAGDSLRESLPSWFALPESAFAFDAMQVFLDRADWRAIGEHFRAD